MKIWIVEGNTGEYEDYDEWIAKAFISKDKAKEFYTECVEYAKYIMEEDYDEDGCRYPRWMFVVRCSPDPNFRIDYTGTFYRLYELEVEE